MAALLAGADNNEGDIRCRTDPAAGKTASNSAHITVQGPSCQAPPLDVSVTGTGKGEAVLALKAKYST